MDQELVPASAVYLPSFYTGDYLKVHVTIEGLLPMAVSVTGW
jgi:hypothetical protein